MLISHTGPAQLGSGRAPAELSGFFFFQKPASNLKFPARFKNAYKYFYESKFGDSNFYMLLVLLAT
jgi:hypothetical protein